MRIWKSELSLDQANSWHNTMIERIGIAIIEIGDDYVRGTMPVDARTHQPYGLLHGGHCGFIRDLTLRSWAEDFIAARLRRVVGDE